MDEEILHLNAKHCSGRAVRIRCLSAFDVDELAIDAFAEAGEGAPKGKARFIELNNGVRQMLVAVTKGPVEADKISSLTEADWHALSLGTLSGDGALSFEKLFGRPAKDLATLKSAYIARHEVTPAEIETILGKAVAVSAD